MTLCSYYILLLLLLYIHFHLLLCLILNISLWELKSDGVQSMSELAIWEIDSLDCYMLQTV